jgi:protein ImuB
MTDTFRTSQPSAFSSQSCYACLYRPSLPESPAPASSLVSIAQEFSPRYEQHGESLIVIDVRGLERLLGSPRTIAHELRREAADRGVLVHVALAGTQTAALVLALARPGLTVIEPGGEASALATLSVQTLEKILTVLRPDHNQPHQTFLAWGLKTLGELAMLPRADLAARLGQEGVACQAIASGEDLRPLVPTLAEERFESSQELDWPIAELEPLSFVLTRLLEPLITRLERRDRGVAVLHVRLHLVTRDVYARQLELSVPLRDVRTLRALALIDLESHPPPAAIEMVTVVVDPTPGRVLQHKLFARACPTPDAISTLVARLGALVGQDRIGAPAVVDSYRPGAFAMKPFALDWDHRGPQPSTLSSQPSALSPQPSALSPQPCMTSALRRCRQPVPARVVMGDGRPVRVTTDRRSYTGGAVLACAGPWRSSGSWWAGRAGRAGRAGTAGEAGGAPLPPFLPSWSREEWDVALADGAIYRIFRDGETDGWFIDAIVD